MNSFVLDRAHNLSTYGYGLDAMLRFEYVNLKLISDIEKYHCIKSIKRDVVSMICKRYVETNN